MEGEGYVLGVWGVGLGVVGCGLGFRGMGGMGGEVRGGDGRLDELTWGREGGNDLF